MAPLSLGKIPIEVLNATVLKMTGAKSASVVTPPRAGLDFAAVKMGEGYLIVSADPVSGVVEDIGWYAVNVSINDVATSGNAPQFIESVVLLPKGSTRSTVAGIADQIHRAAKEASVAIVGGHTEVTPGLDHPVVVITAFGYVRRFVTSAGARPGDSILMTKTAGLEGTAVLAGGLREPMAGLGSGPRVAKKFISQLSIVGEATAAFKTGGVSAMHDCTEGGVLGAVYEMSLASGTGFRLNIEAVPVARETGAICGAMRLDPVKLIGSGSLLLSVRPGSVEDVIGALEPICRVTEVGEFLERKRLVVERGGRERTVEEAPVDELWRALARRP